MIAEIIVYVIFVLSISIAAVVTIAAIKYRKADKSRRFAEGAFDTSIRKSDIFYFVSAFIAIWAALFEVAAFAFKDTPAAGIPIATVFFVAEVISVFLLRNTVNWELELEEESLTHTDLFGRQNIYAYADLTRRPWFGGYRYYARGKFVFGVGFVRGGLVYLNKIMESCGEERRLSVAVKKWESDPATVYARALEEERVLRKSATENDKRLIDSLIASVNETGALQAEYLADILKAKPADCRVLGSIAEKIPDFDNKNIQAKLVEVCAVAGNVAAVPAILGAYRRLSDEQVALYGDKYDKVLAAIGADEYSAEYRELILTDTGAAVFAELTCALAKNGASGIKEALVKRVNDYLYADLKPGVSLEKAILNALKALSFTVYDYEVADLFKQVSLKAPSPDVCAFAEELCFAYKPQTVGT